MMVVKAVTTIVQPRLGVEMGTEKVFVIVSSHQTRKRYRYENLGAAKGRDRWAAHGQ